MHSKRRWFAAMVSALCLVGAPALAWAAEEHGGGGGLIRERVDLDAHDPAIA